MPDVADKKRITPKRLLEAAYETPLRLLVVVFVAVVALEAFVMFILYLEPVGHMLEILLDPLLLGLMLSPVLYYFIFRPMKLQMTRLIDSEERLRVAEVKYRTIFEQSPDSIVIIDPKTAYAVAFNDKACRDLGYTAEEFKHVAVYDYEAIETSDVTQAHVAKVIREGSDEFETRHRTKTGEIRDVQVKANTIEIAGKRLIHSIFSDITDIKAAEEEIRLRAELLNSTTDSIMLLDFNGKFIYANNAAFTQHGYTLEEFLRLNIRDIDTPESAALIEARMNALKEKGFAAFEVEHFRKDGSVLPLEVTARVVERLGAKFILSVMRDITERRRKDKELLERLDELERFLKVTVNRELRIKELSDKIKTVEAELKRLKD